MGSRGESHSGGPKNTDRASIGQAFDPRSNALNLLRLIFAVLVILSHSLVLGGYRSEGSENLWGQASLGQIAVDGFFVISGFLITASAARNSPMRYLWQRFLRIFPAFWVCLLFTATVAGPIGWVAQGNSFGNYWKSQGGPLNYVVGNSFLKMRAYAIGGTPTDVPYPLTWDGSLSTLWYEFLCYLMIAALAITTVLQYRRVVLFLWLLSWALALIVALYGVDIPHPPVVRFTPIFFAGAVLWLYRDRVPDSRPLFLVILLLCSISTFHRSFDAVGAPLLAYICVWASIHLPGKRVGAKYDISYGVYIYAFMVAQVLAIWHIHRWGYLPYTLLTIVVTLILALLSCVLVEQPALRLKKWSPPPLTDWTRLTGRKRDNGPTSAGR